MSGACCKGEGGRKHTPITSEKQKRFAYAVQNVQKGGKGSAKVRKAAKSWPSKGPKSPGAHIKEVEGKKLPESAAKRALARRTRG